MTRRRWVFALIVVGAAGAGVTALFSKAPGAPTPPTTAATPAPPPVLPVDTAPKATTSPASSAPVAVAGVPSIWRVDKFGVGRRLVGGKALPGDTCFRAGSPSPTKIPCP